ncbi:hypothetical protein BG262_06805 [Floricoccus penangensis]|uniref:Uncharacterized protein n=1 Tax=Floricoccus penangensis TaxID=1859475 RepID=A0A9Q5JE12_9LACT|nr:hypothetical protein [Floricoccus penangensis]OFI45700.1 hypothetical protein BG262_06805 [Floricoccus penangensis]
MKNTDMKTRKNLFNASFEQSEQIVPNLFTDKPYLYELEWGETMILYQRVLLIFFAFFGSIVLYGLGIGIPELIAEDPTSDSGGCSLLQVL